MEPTNNWGPPNNRGPTNNRIWGGVEIMDQGLIELKGICLTLPSQAGDVEILRKVDLTVRAGERVGIVGPSGSGKSSLLMIIGGMERASQGVARVLGADIGALDEDRLARLRRDHMGVVFQSFHLIPTMTALENVATPLELAGRADAFDRRWRRARRCCWRTSRPAISTGIPGRRWPT
jgi:predicted ABC-type transport system involved in lysophospholipase L1 biosynthesis ATPase subunit